MKNIPDPLNIFPHLSQPEELNLSVRIDSFLKKYTRTFFMFFLFIIRNIIRPYFKEDSSVEIFEEYNSFGEESFNSDS